jgi:hypothetical protein
MIFSYKKPEPLGSVFVAETRPSGSVFVVAETRPSGSVCQAETHSLGSVFVAETRPLGSVFFLGVEYC